MRPDGATDGRVFRQFAIEGGKPQPLDIPEAPQRVPQQGAPTEFQDGETEQQRQARLAELDRAAAASAKLWTRRAMALDWDQVRTPMEVYRFSGEEVKEDPRRTTQYQERVVEELGFGKDWKQRHPDLEDGDIEAVRAVLKRKAAAM